MTYSRLRHKTQPPWRRLAGASLLLALTAGLAGAATNVVNMGNFSFTPRLLTNQVGDYVIWTNTTITTHDVWSSNSAWTASAQIGLTGHFTNHFTSPGVYGYFCSNHLAFNMTGIIYVQGPAQPPTVSLTNPPNGITLAAPATLTLRAQASDTDGDSITSVQFYSGNTLLGATNISPYAWVVSNLPAGPYSFTARAIDSTGLIATSAPPVNVTVVTPGAFQFADASLTPVNGQFPLSLQGLTPGLRYEIDWSGTFTNWFFVTNFLAASATTNFTTPATGAVRFFKAVLLPNP